MDSIFICNKLSNVATILNKRYPDIHYEVNYTFKNLGTGTMWYTIVAKQGDRQYQVLTPYQHNTLMKALDEEVEGLVETMNLR